jgi:hypothetical protein
LNYKPFVYKPLVYNAKRKHVLSHLKFAWMFFEFRKKLIKKTRFNINELES